VSNRELRAISPRPPIPRPRNVRRLTSRTAGWISVPR